jgi:hypothetical protein
LLLAAVVAVVHLLVVVVVVELCKPQLNWLQLLTRLQSVSVAQVVPVLQATKAATMVHQAVLHQSQQVAAAAVVNKAQTAKTVVVAAAAVTA